MTQVGSVYAQALYGLAKEEQVSRQILDELKALDTAFSQEPAFLRLLSTPSLSKEERCAIIDESFAGKVQPYLLNFLKILMERGYARHFSECCKAYRECYNQDNGILPVQVMTAVPLSGEQSERLRAKLTKLTGKNVVVNIMEVRDADADAQLVAENIAAQLEKRISFRRAMKQAMGRSMQKNGVKGIKLMCSGRLGGAEIARTEGYHDGSIPLQTMRADIQYGFAEAHTTYGRIGCKVWIYKGEVLGKRNAAKNEEGGR